MATVLTATTAATEVVVAPRRGESKAPNFAFRGPLAVIRLELDVSDERMRRRLERQWKAVFRLRRALQRDGAARCRAFWERSHACPACGLRADRDVVSAVLAACVELSDPGDPATARVNYELAPALRAGLASQ